MNKLKENLKDAYDVITGGFTIFIVPLTLMDIYGSNKIYHFIYMMLLLNLLILIIMDIHEFSLKQYYRLINRIRRSR